MGVGDFLSTAGGFIAGGPLGAAAMHFGPGLLKGAADAIHSPQQPGVGGPAAVPARLVRDPTTGYFFDPATGTSYMDGAGTTPVTDPNIAQQVAGNYATQQQFLKQLSTYQAQGAAANKGETGLATNLTDFLNGKGTSQGQVQLQQGLDANNASQLAMVSGTGGQNQAGALRTAMGNMAAGGMQTNSAAAMLRAQEDAAARANLIAVLNNQAAQAQNMYGQAAQGAEGYAQLANTGQQAQQGMNASASQFNAKQNLDVGKEIFKGVGSAVSTGATM